MSSVDFTTDLLLVTCASGKQAAPLLPLLAEKWARLRLITHTEASASRLRSLYPGAEVIAADLTNPASIINVMSGVTAIYCIVPSLHPHEALMSHALIRMAIALGPSFKHFVLSSVLHSQISQLYNHDRKRPVEEALFESQLPFTVLQPTQFMDLIPVRRLAAMDYSVFEVKWSPDSAFSLVALRDLAEAAAKVLEERETHFWACYEINSTGRMTYREVMEKVGKVIGKTVEIGYAPLEERVETLLKWLFREEEVEPDVRRSAQRLCEYYDKQGIVGSPNVLQWLIGRKATSVEEWARIALDSEANGLDDRRAAGLV